MSLKRLRLQEDITDDQPLSKFFAALPGGDPIEEEKYPLPSASSSMSLSGDALKYHEYRVAAAKARALAKAARLAIPRPKRARHLVFPDGSTGYGAYRLRRGRRRRYSGYRRRYRRRIHGRGGFWGDLWGGIKSGASAAWNALRPQLPGIARAAAGPVLSSIGLGGYELGGTGNYMGTGRRQIYGRGAYVDQGVPQVANPGGTDGPIVIRHEEYIGDVSVTNSTGSTIITPFQMLFALALNPGVPSLVPWLSTLANSFQQYQWQGLLITYKTKSGSLATTQALGEIIMAANYNAADSAFTTKQQMLNEPFSVSAVPSCDTTMPVETDPAQTPVGIQYTRGALVPAGQDPRFYDLGTFYMAAQGVTVPANSTLVLGQIWVSYQVALYKPQLPTVMSGTGPGFALYQGITAANATPFGVSQNLIVDNIGLTFTSTVLTLPVSATGTFLMLATWTGSATSTLIGPPATFSSNAFQVATSNCPVGGTDNSTSLMQMLIFTVGDPDGQKQTVTLSTGGTLPTGATLALRLTQVAQNFS